METNADGTYFQEDDHARIKRTRETDSQKPKEPSEPSDDRGETAVQIPQLSAQQQSDLAAIENYARHFGLEQEGLAFAHQQAGLPSPTEEQKQVAEKGLPVRPEQPAKKTPPSNHGGFYLGETPL